MNIVTNSGLTPGANSRDLSILTNTRNWQLSEYTWNCNMILFVHWPYLLGTSLIFYSVVVKYVWVHTCINNEVCYWLSQLLEYCWLYCQVTEIYCKTLEITKFFVLKLNPVSRVIILITDISSNWCRMNCTHRIYVLLLNLGKKMLLKIWVTTMDLLILDRMWEARGSYSCIRCHTLPACYKKLSSSDWHHQNPIHTHHLKIQSKFSWLLIELLMWPLLVSSSRHAPFKILFDKF